MSLKSDGLKAAIGILLGTFTDYCRGICRRIKRTAWATPAYGG